MKKLTSTLLALALIVTTTALTACGDNNNGNGGDNTGDNTGNTTSATATSDDNGNAPPANGNDSNNGNTLAGAVNGYTQPFRGHNIVLGSNIVDVLAALGEPAPMEFKEESCAFLGYDYIYRFPNIEISTFSPNGEDNHVLGIKLLDDSITTGNGAYIGMSEAEIADLYGTPTELGGAANERHFYEKDGMSLEFLFDNGAVDEIFYLYDATEFMVEE
jgi:hypothetical protein